MNLFVSYAHRNRRPVEKIIKLLEKGDNVVWYDDRLKPGEQWKNAIEKALTQAEVFVYMITPASLNSRWCWYEFYVAAKHGKKILPVLLEKSELPPQLSPLQYADFTRGATSEATAKLMAGLHDITQQVPVEKIPEPTIPEGNPPKMKNWGTILGLIIGVIGVVIALLQLIVALSPPTPPVPTALSTLSTKPSDPTVAVQPGITAVNNPLPTSDNSAPPNKDAAFVKVGSRCYGPHTAPEIVSVPPITEQTSTVGKIPLLPVPCDTASCIGNVASYSHIAARQLLDVLGRAPDNFGQWLFIQSGTPETIKEYGFVRLEYTEYVGNYSALSIIPIGACQR